MKTLAQPHRLVMSLLCAAGCALAVTASHAADMPTGQLRLDGSTARVGKADPYTDGARVADRRSAFVDGARVGDARNPFSEGARMDDTRDGFSQGA